MGSACLLVSNSVPFPSPVISPDFLNSRRDLPRRRSSSSKMVGIMLCGALKIVCASLNAHGHGARLNEDHGEPSVLDRDHAGGAAQSLPCGIFPMAESADDPALYWIEPEKRGIIPLDPFHVPDRLARTVRADRFTVTADRDFDAVIDGCAEPSPGRTRTWINVRIRNLYRKLYDRGDCHSVEVYDGDDWSAAFTASVSAAPFSARACSTANAMPRRSLSCTSSRGSRPAITACSTPSSSPTTCARSAPSRCRAAYHRLLDARSSARRISPRRRSAAPIPGLHALAGGCRQSS